MAARAAHHIDVAPDQRVAITGANSGVGFEAARLLAAAGATVVLMGRSDARIARARDIIARRTRDARVETLSLDLASLASVRRAADALAADGVDVLVNNAGLMAIPRCETEEGFEMQLGVNHLGHFALTALLWPRIRRRVVTVTSLLHRVGRLDFDDLMGERRYRKWGAYAQSKLANVLFALELHRGGRAAGSSVGSMLCHPGYSATEITSKGPDMTGDTLVRGVMDLGNALIAQSATAGAETTVLAAIGDVPSGSLVGPSLFGWRGRPRLAMPSRAGRDEQLARRLWDVSESLTGVSFDPS